MDHLSRLIARAFASAIGRKLGYLAVGAVVTLCAGWCSSAHAAVAWQWSRPTDGAWIGAASPAAAASAFMSFDITRRNAAETPASGCGTPTHAGANPRSNASNSFVEYDDTYTPNCPGSEPAVYPRSTSLRSITCPGAQIADANGTCGPPQGCDGVAAALNSQPEATRRGYSAFQSSASCTNVINEQGCYLSGEFSARLNATSPWIAYGGSGWRVTPNVSICGAATTPPVVVPTLPQQLPPGKCPGEFNGTTIIVDCGEASSPPVADRTTNSSNTQTARTENITSCSGDFCTTVTRTYNGSNVLQTTRTVSESAVDYCGRNPNSGACRGTGRTQGPGTGSSGNGTGSGEGGGGSFGGSCAGGFTCEGDAIQCAIAADQHRRHCTLFDLENPLSTIGTPAMNGQAQPAGHPGAAASAASLDFATVIDRTDRLPGSCPADITIATSGPPLVIPLASGCSSLQLLGTLMVGICMLAALGIVFRG